MGKNYWMVVESQENHEITREKGFEVFGFGQPFRRRAQRMQQGDMVLFYVSTIRKWTATATITSGYFEDYTPVWAPTTRGEQYPFRVKLKPDIRLDEGQYIDALYLAPRLDYLKRWTPEDWPLAFADRLHLIPQRDFRLIESEMQRVTGLRQRSAKRRRRKPRRQPQPAGAMAIPGDGAAPTPASPEPAEPQTVVPQSNGGASTATAPGQSTETTGESDP